MSTPYNLMVPLGVIAMISKGCMLFWISIGHALIKVIQRENQIGAGKTSCLSPLIAHQETVSYKRTTPWALSIYV